MKQVERVCGDQDSSPVACETFFKHGLDLSYTVFAITHNVLDVSGDRGESVMVVSFDLQTFILRARVLKLYRQALRITKRAPADSRAELMQTIRQEMENNRDCRDKQRIRYLISDGLERVKRLDEMLDMQGR